MSVRLSHYSDSGIRRMYSKHSAPGCRMLGIIRNNDVTPSSLRNIYTATEQKMAAASGTEASQQSQQNQEFLRKKGYSWSREETLLLISIYQEMSEYFQNVNYKKKKSVGDNR